MSQNPHDNAIATLDRMEQQAKSAHEELSNCIQGMIDLIDNWKKENGIA